MKNVLVALLLSWILAMPTNSASAPPDRPFCPDGWICGEPRGHAYELVAQQENSAICTISHEVLSDDGRLRLFMLLVSTHSPTSVEIGFGISLLEPSLDGSNDRPQILSSARILSGDRVLDTRAWQVFGANSERIIVRYQASDETARELGAATRVATGATYGLIAQKRGGQTVRFEVRSIKQQTLIVEKFQACIEQHARLLGK
ncbi:MAG: hypothetical protein GC202_09760 [Alphaproteobacteria bacterium]|nr:hypothetical protein [Alphaproteobacteria bacterium]